MAKLKVFSLRDSALAAFGRPFFLPTVASAERSLADEVNSDKAQSQVAAHPGDYELFMLGSFDEETARFEQLDAPLSVCRADTLVRK